jgi:putative nucleotidyltransferase with HDIG domain
MPTNFRETLTLSMPTAHVPVIMAGRLWTGCPAAAQRPAVESWIRPEVHSLMGALELYDADIAEHCQRVAEAALWLAARLGCDRRAHEWIYLAALLHDIGKIGIDEALLSNRGPLTDSQREQVRRHPEHGHAIVCRVGSLTEVAPIVLYHHEAWDGSGYPFGLSGCQIPLAARICAVADAFDAMSHDRPYQRALAPDMVDARLDEGSGAQWDPTVVDVYIKNRDELRQALGRHELRPKAQVLAPKRALRRAAIAAGQVMR